MSDFRVLFQNSIWLFIIGGALGVLIEGLWWRYRYGFWQAHTTLLWAPLCTIYGFGCAGCYVGTLMFREKSVLIQFLTFGIIGALVEYIGGALLFYGLGMRAWDYSDTFLNIKGFVNLKMALVWGLFGTAFQILTPALNKIFSYMNQEIWWRTTVFITAFLVADTIFSSIVLYRWSKRHQGLAAGNGLYRFIDRRYPDEKMEKRFNNWYFTDTGSVNDARTKPFKETETT